MISNLGTKKLIYNNNRVERVFFTLLGGVFLVCLAASALGQVTKEQVDVFFPHIFNQSVSVYICICIEQRDVECQR